jgi:hypothetical protein
MELYEFAIILQPKEDKDGNLVEPGLVLVDPKTILASSPENATLVAAKAIPDEQMGDLDRITVVVRPF